MTFQPKGQSRDWARSVLAANYDKLFEQYHRQHETCAAEKSELRDNISELEKKLENHSDTCDAGKYDELLRQFQHEHEICAGVKIKLRETISELEQKLQKQSDACDAEKARIQNEICTEGKSKLQDNISELEQKLQEQNDACDAEKTRLQKDLTNLQEEKDEELQRANAMIAGLEHDNLVLQRGDRTNSGDDDFVELQRLSAENYNLRYEVEDFEARLASMQDDNQRAMEKTKPHRPSNDPDYHCECCGRRRTSHGDTPVCISVTDHWHPSAVDMTVSTQDMRARLREMQEKCNEKHEELEQCEEQRKNAVRRAFHYAAERRKAEKELGEAQSGSFTQKYEALDKICADLRRRLRALYEAIETNGEAVRQAAEDALDGIDRARRG
ncbi:hypothetical protein HBH70_215950 [Parastagonospora nodorum]|nr:hypothetical protein HBI09_134410 [Parastagonospora nodorum]KAH4063720.1 hypothetical protein HBH50_185680 [Parastagonospora nodorum]KAH4078572.1 hypothetical protein HBH48_228220 [Parastagonospora nodorum]KAH4113351.1 hypothetical protein HBH47_212730 [Parastagonospora nodorum]KAH4187080.1 hypothetical protein HBH42_162800 [Parastagonospora nodorum]